MRTASASNQKKSGYTNKSRSKKALLKTCMTALFAALIAGGTFIAIPIGPVPIVLQNFFVVLSGLVLGPLLGTAAVGLYLLAGLLGAPVFAGFTSGLVRLAGPTGGFLAGYLLAALITGLIAGRPGMIISGRAHNSLKRLIAAVAAGFLVVYVPGILWLKIVTELDWNRAFLAGLFPFIPGDIFKGIAAVLIAKRARTTAADLFNV